MVKLVESLGSYRLVFGLSVHWAMNDLSHWRSELSSISL